MTPGQLCRAVLIVLIRNQFYDYTKQPVHEALIQNPPSSKFDVILEAVGLAYVPFYKHSEAYLAPNGIYISVGPIPHGFGEALSLLWNIFMRPKWAGGTKRRFTYVPSPTCPPHLSKPLADGSGLTSRKLRGC